MGTSGGIGKEANVDRKPVSRLMKEYFPVGPVQYDTAQSEIGKHYSGETSHEISPSARKSARRKAAAALKAAEIDPWKRSSDSVGAHSEGFAADPTAKTKDILGQVNLDKERRLSEKTLDT